MTIGPSRNVCDGFWDKKVEPTEECKEDVPPAGVTHTTHQNDIGVWEVDKDPPYLMETANAGCMQSPRQGSFGRVQFQDESPGQAKCSQMQQCNDFSWLPWYKNIS